MVSKAAQRMEDLILLEAADSTERLSEKEILERATDVRAVLSVSDQEFDEVIKRIHAKLTITLSVGISIAEEHKKWLHSRKSSIDPFYWDRYRRYLFGRLKWSPLVVNTLDRVTDEILELAGDPNSVGGFARKGLIVGEVQSGKTATYTALCCKAADAGYELIILLTGTVESLRRQTQERLDQGFVGRDSFEVLQKSTKIHKNVAVGAGEFDQRKFAVVFTSRSRDFSIQIANQLNLSIANASDPILLVCKKNAKILENLRTWLETFNANDRGRISAPLLLIDDEADNASVNTNKDTEEATRTNSEIRAILKLFDRSCYTGVTATPFANIFIHPETVDEMIGDDLFPKDFIYSLESPTNYLGPRTIFGLSGDDGNSDEGEPVEGRGPFLREVVDMEPCLPLKHKIDAQITELPNSLREAIHSFILATTIRDLRNEGPTHRSMLINVSRFVGVQGLVGSLVHSEVEEIKREMRLYSHLPPDDACDASSSIAALRELWSSDFVVKEFPWASVQAMLNSAVQPILVSVVNQKSGAGSLDYSAAKENGLRVIAVGGNSLSRGLTLEGLSTSYFYRNSQMYDTLLQMGRWFGYRPGYDDLCRIWMTRDAASWYTHIVIATDELRREFRIMRELKQTPREFGLRVRAHPDSLIVTARNKMRTARDFVHYITFSGVGLETPRLRSDSDVNRHNLETTLEFLRTLPSACRAAGRRNSHPFWRGVPKNEIAAFLGRFWSDPTNFNIQLDAISEFIAATGEPQLKHWDVVIIAPRDSRHQKIDIGRTNVYPVERRIDEIEGGRLLISGSKQRVGSIDDEAEGLTEDQVERARQAAAAHGKGISGQDYRDVRSHPLLLIYFVCGNAEVTGVNRWVDPEDRPVVAIGLSFPRFSDEAATQKAMYKINQVEWRSRFESDLVPDDDVVEEDVGVIG